MRHRGIVIQREDNRISVKMQDSAETCGNCKGCVRLTPRRPSEDYIVQINDPKNEYAVGDEVIVEMGVAHLVKAVAVLYGVPFVSLFLGYVLTRWIFGSDPLAGLGGIGGVLIGALLARPVARRLTQKEQELKIVARACA
ncbi:MAG: SoxR reducing system RseC family protein [Firmicutes bacterium]|nr:SoxR reducing system RseC family protein [Bacillota bacterium]